MGRDLVVAVGVLLVLLSVLCWSATGYWARRAERFRRLGRRETVTVLAHRSHPQGGRSRGPSAALEVAGGEGDERRRSVEVDEADLARHPVGSSVEVLVLPGQPSDVMLAERLEAFSLRSSLAVSFLCSLLCLLWWVVVRRSGYSPAGLAAAAVEGASKGRPSGVPE